MSELPFLIFFSFFPLLYFPLFFPSNPSYPFIPLLILFPHGLPTTPARDPQAPRPPGSASCLAARRSASTRRARRAPPPPRTPSLPVLTVDYHIKVRLDLQADKSSVVVKGPFFP
jgi:hypothetical protein